MSKFTSQSNTEFTILSAGETSSVSVGTLNLEPIPFVSIAREEYKAGPHTIGGVLNVSLEGFVFGTGFKETSSGVQTIQNVANDYSKGGFITGINVKCGDTYIVRDGIGTVEALTFDQGPQRNWMNVIPYTMELQVHETGSDGGNFAPVVTPYSGTSDTFGIWNGAGGTTRGINDLSETFTINFDDNAYYHPLDGSKYNNKHIRLEFDISAGGATSLSAYNTNYGLKGINQLLVSRVTGLALGGLNSILMDKSGHAFNIADADADGDSGSNSFSPSGKLSNLSYTIDELNNTASVQGEIVYFPADNDTNATLTMDMDHNNNIEGADKSFTINGSIQGYADRVNSDGDDIFSIYQNIGSTAMDNAETALTNILGSSFQVPQDLINGATGNLNMSNNNGIGELGFNGAFGAPQLSMNVGVGYAPAGSNLAHVASENNLFRLISKNIKRNYDNHSIDFSLNYSNKRFKIPGALWAEINVDHQIPARRLVEHVVPGRGYPITQDINCTNLETFTLTLTAQLEPTGDATVFKNSSSAGAGQAHMALLAHATGLGCNLWALTQDNESFGNNGTYRRTFEFTKTSCNV